MRVALSGYSPGEGMWLGDFHLCQNIYPYITAPVPAPNVPVAEVFGTGIHWHLVI